MNLTKRIYFVVAIAACVILPARASQATDHLDGTKTSADPSADLTDVFAFTSPSDASKVVLVMDVHPLAFASTQFSDVVAYKFRIRPVDSSMHASSDSSQESSIVCTFAVGTASAPSQQATCKLQLQGGVTDSVTFATRGGTYQAGGEGTSGTTKTRIFSGVRSDPYATDTARVGAYYKLQAPPTGPTKNALKGFNVLSIVVEIPKANLPGPLFAVAAQTVRS